MAHELATQANGTAAMAFVGVTPWHGLGQSLQEGADIETWKQAAGMDWSIQRAAVQYDVPGRPFGQMPERHVLFRSDTSKALSVVSRDYKVVQPAQVLEFFRDLVSDNGFQLHTAGVLYEGKRLWALAKIGPDAVVVGDDKVGGYLLLSTACDGTMATTARFTSVRVVCNNTLSMAVNSHSRKLVKVNHSSQFDAGRVHNELGVAHGEFAKFLDAARHLTTVPVSLPAMKAFTTDLLLGLRDLPPEAPETFALVQNARDAVQKSEGYSQIMRLFMGAGRGSTLPGAEGTAWGAVNAVTEYVDHFARARSTNNRLNNAWFGAGDDLKTAALESALAL